VFVPSTHICDSFGGPVIYENKEFVSPNQVRADLRRAKAGRYNQRTAAAQDNRLKRGELGLNTHGGRKNPKDPLNDHVLFA
jgi:ribosome biogenesis protein BRX1